MNLNGNDVIFNDVHELLHTLWTKAVGGERYNKGEWKKLEALLFGLWREAGGTTSMPAPGERLSVKAPMPLQDRPLTRRDIHGEWDHSSCPDPAQCVCECRACKRAWFDAGRPSPPPPAPEEPVLSVWDRLRQPGSRT